MSKKVIKIKAAPDQCGGCKFLLLDNPGDEAGECRRYPPTPVSDEGEHMCICPRMAITDWCGEFAHRLNS